MITLGFPRRCALMHNAPFAYASFAYASLVNANAVRAVHRAPACSAFLAAFYKLWDDAPGAFKADRQIQKKSGQSGATRPLTGARLDTQTAARAADIGMLATATFRSGAAGNLDRSAINPGLILVQLQAPVSGNASSGSRARSVNRGATRTVGSATVALNNSGDPSAFATEQRELRQLCLRGYTHSVAANRRRSRADLC